MISRTFLAVGLALMLGGPLVAAEPETLESRVDAVFSEWDKSDSPGCALGVFRDGQLHYARGYGMANLELGVRITPQSVFDVGSTSKQFTAMAVLLLSKDGVLSLDDDIRKFVPEIPGYGSTITIRHLLHHTSGIRDYCGLLTLAGHRTEDITNDEDALQILSRQKALNFKPGDEHLYSNSGYFLLSLVVKRASRRSLRDFAQESIFGPLGMRHTQYNDDHTRIIPGRATGYSPGPDGHYGIDMSDWEQTGDGAVLTTVEDLLFWDRNFYDPKVGGPDLVARMQVPGILNGGKALRYAAGLQVGMHRGLRTVSHGGAWAGYRAELIRFPDQKLSVACLCNLGTVNPNTLATKVAEIYLGQQMTAETPAATAPAIDVSAAELQRNAGAYRNPKTGGIWRLAVDGGRLMADASGLRFQLVPIAAGSFRAEGAPFKVAVDIEPASGVGRPRLKVAIADEDVPRVLEPVDLWVPSANDLAELAGRYRSEELGIAYTVTHKDGKLWVSHRSLGEQTLEPSLKDTFETQGTTIVFTRDARSWIDGFDLKTGRAQGIRFSREEKP